MLAGSPKSSLFSCCMSLFTLSSAVGESVSTLPLWCTSSDELTNQTERPVVLPLYLSSPAFNFVSMTSYTNFCFMYFIRVSAFHPFASTSSSVSHAQEPPHNGSLRDGLAETFYFYSQNLPTVALLLPRAALSLALLLGFSSPTIFPLRRYRYLQ